MQNYIATQTENGFYVEFENSSEQPKKIGFEEIEEFAYKFNQTMLAGEQPKLDDNEKLLLSLWEMLMIPDNTIH